MATDLDTSTTEPPATPGAARAAPTPGWLDEVVEVLELRRTVLVATALGLSFLGVLTAIVVPQLLPPRPLVGAAVGLAAILLAVAAALGVDSVDLTIRGPRHIRASGGRLAAELAGSPDARTVAPLAAAVGRRAGTGRGRVGITPASEAAVDARAWAEAVARALSGQDLRVLLIDLVTDRPGRPGVAEVAAGERRLAEAVEFDHELMLATLGAGRDRGDALGGLPSLVERLPGDIEALVVALPHLSDPGALAAAGALDRILVLVEEDETPRVDLIATLDAVDATAAASEVVLLSPAPRVTPSVRVPIAEPVEAAALAARSPDQDALDVAAADAEPAPRPPLAAQQRDHADAAAPVDAAHAPGNEGAADAPAVVDAAAAPGTVDDVDDEATEDAPLGPEDEALEAAPHAGPVEDDDLAAEDWGDGETAVVATAGIDAESPDPDASQPAVDAADEDVVDVEAPRDEVAVDAAAEPDLALDEPAAVADPVEHVEDVEDVEGGVEPAAAADEVEDVEDVEDVDAEPAAIVDVRDDVEPDPDPTLETPPVVVHDEVIAAADGDPDDRDPQRWATPSRHEELVGSHLATGPFPDQQDLPEDPVRVAAALQTLAAEVWQRDDEES